MPLLGRPGVARQGCIAAVLTLLAVSGLDHAEINAWLDADRRSSPNSELMSWDDAYAHADNLIRQMTRRERYSILNGIGYGSGARNPEKWWYIGNTPAIPRLGIPSLNIQDSSGGFRPLWKEMLGTVTCWPSMLALAASWDPSLVHEVAKAIGDEFTGKGGNVILGPSVNVHRIARGGRNFEYISGEDPHLGSRLVEAYVTGVQSRGVAAVVKHWVFNEQETNRHEERSYVDEVTAWQLYYPPFASAVNAGVAGVMCSYNKIGRWASCSNAETLVDLKDTMGFRGFVQSDWWAADNSSFSHGLDQDMPGNDGHMTAEDLEYEGDEAVGEAAKRVLASLKRLGLEKSAKCSPPHCTNFLLRNVTRSSHTRLAQMAATESIVLLKNEDDVLPITVEKAGTIAVIGSAAVAAPYDSTIGSGFWKQGDYYSGGGSGHISTSRVVTPLEGIQMQARSAGVKVTASTSNDLHQAVSLAGSDQVDVAIVVVATTSGEAGDRPDLHLDNEADALIAAVATTARKTVVLCQVPGAVLMPWRHQVHGIALMFLGGQQTGAAWASVIFGDASPEGRLPIMLPETEQDTIHPSQDLDVPYSEGLETSYRSRHFKASFPFGHGLSYTTFAYGSPIADTCDDDICIRVQITNMGTYKGRAVPQLYLEFPPELKQPSKTLRGFKKTKMLEPRESAGVTFRLAPQHCAYYLEGPRWVMANKFTAHIADSASDIKSSINVNLESDTGDIFDYQFI